MMLIQTFLPTLLLCRLSRARSLATSLVRCISARSFVLTFPRSDWWSPAFSPAVVPLAPRNSGGISALFLTTMLFSPSWESMNVWANATPKFVLSEHPDHLNPSAVCVPVIVWSHPQPVISPVEQARVTEWPTPAEETAWRNAASRVPVTSIVSVLINTRVYNIKYTLLWVSYRSVE